MKFLQKMRQRLFIFLVFSDFALVYVLKIFACGAKRRRLFFQNFEIQEKNCGGYLSPKISPKVAAAVIQGGAVISNTGTVVPFKKISLLRDFGMGSAFDEDACGIAAEQHNQFRNVQT